MKVQELDPTEVKYNPAIAARAGDLDKENVADIATSYITRREANQIHQIQPGVVRNGSSGFEVIVGRHRLAACMAANESLAKGEEPFLFNAIVVKDGDKNALITAITENEKRKDSTIFDRADAMQRLVDLGMSQDEVAKVYGLDKSTVSQTLASAKLPAKLRKMVLAGDMEQDAALLVASPDIDSQTRNEVIEHAIAHRNFIDEMESKLTDKAKQAAKGGKVDGKEPEPDAKASDTDASEKSGARVAKKGAKASKLKKEDIARAAKAIPAAKASRAAQTSSTLSRKQFIVALEAMYVDKDNPMPKSARAIVSRMQAFYDGEISDTQLRNALVKNCLPD